MSFLIPAEGLSKLTLPDSSEIDVFPNKDLDLMLAPNVGISFE